MEKEKLLKIITVSVTVFIALLVISLIINLVKLSSMNSRKAELEAELIALDNQIQRNDATIDYVRSDEYIDRYAREYLDMIGKDEEAFY